MNCEQANQLDLVDYLNSIGYPPLKIKGADYWYLSPLRAEKTPSFKVERNKNVWYDHGTGKGGRLVDFVMEFCHCDVREALLKISSFHQQKSVQPVVERSPFHLQESNVLNPVDARETAIKIIAAKSPVTDFMLCRYLLQRRIAKNVADTYCCEVHFTNGNNEKIYRAIGFKNNAGGYELRNEFFKGCSSPKYVTYLGNKSDSISVFEGFFDFLSYQSLHQGKNHRLTNLPGHLSNSLVLNSLAFFERSLLLMEKHSSVRLYLDQDAAGRKCTEVALKRSSRFLDESKLYKGYKDLNDWMMTIGNRDLKLNRSFLGKRL